jgi:hypothetical protein
MVGRPRLRQHPSAIEPAWNVREPASLDMAMWDSMFSAGTYGRMSKHAKDRAVGTLSQVLSARHPTYKFTQLPGVGPDRPVASPVGRQVSFEITGPNDEAPVVCARTTADKHGVDGAAENPPPFID